MQRISLGSPHSLEGENSAYVLTDSATVIDPGPSTDESWRALSDGIDEAGLSLGDISHILVTHWHGDHSGLAPRLASHADASIYLHSADAPIVRNYEGTRERRRHRVARLLRRWGAPPDVVAEVKHRKSSGAGMAQCQVTELKDGDEIAGAEVLYTPGHTQGHVTYKTEHGYFVGDLILPSYTPNVGGSDIRVKEPLATYILSLAQLNRTAKPGFPGHGDTVDINERIRTIVRHHENRNQLICSILYDGQRPTSPWEVATKLFGEMNGVHVQMGVGEAVAHLQYLKRKDVIDQVTKDPFKFVLKERPDPNQLRIDLPSL